MSFMKGFGDAFSKSFEQAAQKRADKEADIMRYQFQNFIDRRKSKEEREAADAKRVQDARTLAKVYGNEKAWPLARDLLAADVPKDEIARQIQTGKYTERAGAAVDQTQASGMAPPVPAPAPSKPVNLMDKLLGPKRTPEEKSIGKISEITGQTPDEINQIMAPPVSSGVVEPEYDFTPAKPEFKPFTSEMEAKQALATAKADLEKDPENPQLIERYTATLDRVKMFTDEEVDDSQRTVQQAVDQAKALKALEDPKPDQFNTPFEANQRLAEVKRIDAAGSTPSTRREVEIAQERLDQAVFWAEWENEDKARRKAAAEGLARPGGVKYKQIDPKTKKITYTTLIEKDGKWLKRNPDRSLEPVNIDDYDAVLPDEQKDMIALGTNFGKDAKEYFEKKNSLRSVALGFRRMGTLVRATEGQILSGTTMGVVGTIVDTVQNLNTAAKILTFEAGRSGSISPEKAMSLEQQIEEETIKLGSNITDLNTANALFEAQAALITFNIGRMYGQTGQALSDKDRQFIENLSKGGYTPEQFYQNAANLVFNLIGDLKSQHSTLMEEAPNLQTISNIYGGLPFEAPDSWEDEVSKDPNLGLAMEEFTKNYDFKMSTQQEDVGSTPEAPYEFTSDDPAEQEKEFKKLKKGRYYKDPGDGKIYQKD